MMKNGLTTSILLRTTLSAALASSWMLVAPAHAEPFVVIQPPGSMILDTTLLADCVEQFSEEDRWFFGVTSDAEVSAVNNGVYGGQFVKNADAYDYLKENIPLFDCPDADFAKTYYFRWWTYRKHIKNLGTAVDPDLIVTEFIDPVGWADSSNAITLHDKNESKSGHLSQRIKSRNPSECAGLLARIRKMSSSPSRMRLLRAIAFVATRLARS